MHFLRIHPNFQAIYNFANVSSVSPALFLVCFGSFLFLYVPVFPLTVWFMMAHSAFFFFLFVLTAFQCSDLLPVNNYILCKSGALLHKNPLKK